MATGLLDAGGRNVAIGTRSRSGYFRRTSTVGLAIFLQYWCGARCARRSFGRLAGTLAGSALQLAWATDVMQFAQPGRHAAPPTQGTACFNWPACDAASRVAEICLPTQHHGEPDGVQPAKLIAECTSSKRVFSCAGTGTHWRTSRAWRCSRQRSSASTRSSSRQSWTSRCSVSAATSRMFQATRTSSDDS